LGKELTHIVGGDPRFLPDVQESNGDRDSVASQQAPSRGKSRYVKLFVAFTEQVDVEHSTRCAQFTALNFVHITPMRSIKS
jgi:hypothetical protein